MRVVAALIACSGALVAASCGGTSGAAAPTMSSTAAGSAFRAPMVVQRQVAPPIRLRDQRGRPVSLRAERGKAVAVTFVYTHCPNTCPLILQALTLATRRLGADARRFAVLAVSVDPKGDRPAYVRRFLRRRHVASSVRYLLGTRRQLLPVWAAYNVAANGDPKHPENIEHSAFIYLIDSRGRLRLLYPAQPLDEQALVHDIRLLAHGA